MDTLYELLGALPKDDAEGLRIAFRKAVKGAHPDLRPDDPDAAVKFRQIVRANEILLDRDQRAVYDHLLVLAEEEKDPAAAHPIAATIHKVASTVLALASLSIVTAGGYFLFMHMSLALPGSLMASTSHTAPDLTTRLTASIAAVSPSAAPNRAAINAFRAAKSEGPPAPPSSPASTIAMATADAESASPPAAASAPPEQPSDRASSTPRAHEVPAFAIGEISGTPGDADHVIQLDRTLTAPYVNRGLLFFRDKKDDHALPDLSPLKRADKQGRPPKPLVAPGGRPHADATPPKPVPPMPMPRTAPRYETAAPPRYETQSSTNWYATN